MNSKKNNHALLLLILAISALGIRALAFQHTLMINVDGPIYIHQARVVYYGLWDALGTCGDIDYPTVFAILTAAAYSVIGDWSRSAMIVNLFFGTATIIPLYFFLERFVERKTAFLTAFIFAMLPLFVIQSVNVIRDPSYWFFSVLGLYFLSFDTQKRTLYFLIFSSLSFIVATTMRIEGLVFLIGGVIYTLIVFNDRKLQATLCLLVPIALALAGVIIGQHMIPWDNHGLYCYRADQITSIFTGLFENYQQIRSTLKAFMDSLPAGSARGFVELSHTLVWFTAIGAILHCALEALMYIFFFLLLFGLSGLKSRMKSDNRLLPLLFTTLISLVVLYIYCLNIWSMENRRFIMVIIPATVFMGFGVEKLIRWLRARTGLSDSLIVIVLCVSVLAVTLPKNMNIQEADKLVYKDIGETIAHLDGSPGEINLITLGDTWRWVDYYANLHVSGAPCPDKYVFWNEIDALAGKKYEDFVGNLRKRQIRYVVWQENYWPRDKFIFLKSVRPEDLSLLKEWRHQDTGRIILYKVLYHHKNVQNAL